MRDFHFSNICTILGLILAYMWAGTQGVVIAGLLILMEVSLSFDNAVVNATVLKNMEEKWRKRFMTWGILIAVFGMRLVFPIVLVAFATGLSMVDVSFLAFKDPDEYSKHVLASNVEISVFGGIFLLMVFLHFVFDESKEVHWIGFLERRLSAAGRMQSLEVIIALVVLLALQSLVDVDAKLSALVSGLVGLLLYVTINSTMSLFSNKHDVNKTMVASGFIGFIYLQLLDASFSLDGVIGAFAISKDVVIIMIGLGVGAIFVRSMTAYMVKKGTLDAYVFLEHGAHYGIGALAVIMFAHAIGYHVPETVTGLIGLACTVISWWSSVKYNKINRK